MNEDGGPPRESSNPRQFIFKRQGSNKHFDPFGELAMLTHAFVLLLSPFALSIMVFLRHKLGYRMAKPVMLITVFCWLFIIAVIVNVLAYGWFRVNRDTPVGEYLHRIKVAQIQQMYAVKEPPSDPETEEGFIVDAPYPPDWRQRTRAQQLQWLARHTVDDPKLAAKLSQEHMKRAQQRQEAVARQQEQLQQALTKADAQWEAKKKSLYLLHLSMFIFAGAFLWLGILRRKEGARLIKQNWHTMSRGVSYLTPLFPNTNEYRLQAFYEPGLVFLLGAACAIGGLYLSFVSFTLGVWLMFAAVCLSLSEIVLMELALNEALDKYDAEIEGRQYSDIRKAIRSSVENQRVESTGGIRGAVFDPETVAILRAAALGEIQHAAQQPVAQLDAVALSQPAAATTPTYVVATPAASVPPWVLAVIAFLVPVAAVTLYMLLRH